MLWGQLVMNCRAGIYVDGESAEGPRFSLEWHSVLVYDTAHSNCSVLSCCAKPRMSKSYIFVMLLHK